MKQRTRRWLIAAAILTVLGLALFAGAMAMVHWDFNQLNMPFWG